MELIPFLARGWESNSYLLVEGSHALLVDAGAAPATVLTALAGKQATLDRILLTHGHFDHILNIDELRKETGAQVSVHTDDAEMLTDGSRNAFSVFFGKERTWAPADGLLSDDDVFFGDNVITVYHTPGHTPGGVCYRVGGWLFTGDTLMRNGFGRYDLSGGNRSALTSSLMFLTELPGNLHIYPGHGGDATLTEALGNIGFTNTSEE